MKKYVLPVAASVVAGVVLLGACSDQSERPENLTGPVDDKQVEKCETLSMGLVGFEGKSAGSSGGKGGGSKSPAKTDSGSKVDTKKPETVKTPDAVSTQKPGKSGSSKPSKPKGSKPKSCSTEYELLINTTDGVFEEDVTLEVYELCQIGEQYPACAKG